MATKTFEELKQMAIQIRDEKTNKQNTATRIGTQMLEHLNKLEQDFLDKDTTEGKFFKLESEKVQSEFVYGEDVILGYGLAYDAKNSIILSKDGGVIVSPFIPISNGDSIEWAHRFMADNNFRAVMYDSNKQVLDSWGAGDLGWRTISVSEDNVAYFRFTMNNVSSDECFVKVNDVKVWNDGFYKKTLKEHIDNPSQGDVAKSQEVELREIANENELIIRRRFAELNGEIVEEEWNHVSTTGAIGYISPYIAVSGTIDVWLNYSKVVGYDENRRFVDFWRTTDAESTIEIPSEVKYIRVAVYNESLSQSYVKNHDTGAVIWKPFQITRPSKSILELFPQEEYEPLIANITNDLKLDSPEHNSPRIFGMLFLGDLHTCDGIMREVMEFYNLYNLYLNSIVLGGDMVNYWDDGFDWWASVGAKRCLPIIGNHEVLYDYHKYAQGSGSATAPKVNGVEVDIYKLTCVSAKQCYDRYIKPYLAHTAFTSYVDGKCYWYKDFEEEKLRLIGLDDFHWKESVPLVGGEESSVYPDGTSVDTGGQQIWFRNVLEDARTKGYKVLVSHHAPAEFDAIDCPFTIQDFNNKGTRSKATDDELAEVQTFIDNGGTFVAWLTGHLHQDVIGTCKNYPNQLQLAIDTSRIPRNINGSSVYQGGNYKIADTKSNYCLDVVAVTEKMVTIQRIGTEYDKIGRKIESFVYNFVTHNIVYK